MRTTQGGARRDPAPFAGPYAPKHAASISVVALAIVVAFAIYLRFVSTSPLGIDLAWHDAFAATPGSAGYAVAVFLAQVGGGLGVAACTGIIAALFFVLRQPRAAATVMTATIAGVVLSELCKHLIARPRPWGQVYESAGSSYPSGHTMGAAALAISVALAVLGVARLTKLQRRLVVAAACAWVVAMALSRTALHVHWLTDTFGGALLGLAAALIADKLWANPAMAARQTP